MPAHLTGDMKMETWDDNRVSYAAEKQQVESKARAGMVQGAALAGGNLGQEIRQSEIEREIHNLLRTAEQLENVVDRAVKAVEKVTSNETKALNGKDAVVQAPTCSTMLGRDLDSINGRLQSSMNILQSTIQRIEL